MKKSLIAYLAIVLIFTVVCIGTMLWRNNTNGYRLSDFDTTQITKINLNTATTQQLQMIPRIGPVLADRIIEYRETHGQFEKVEDILNVKGIGTKMLPDFLKYTTTGEVK